MRPALGNTGVIRFGPFEADLHTRELRKQGLRIKLQLQPFQVLAMLLERPGELVTREEIRAKLWSGDTFVDFEHGLNAAIRRLRDALNDSAETPRYVETLPRRGYRFIARLQGRNVDAAEDAAAIRSLAVLPLANLSGDANQDYLADGMTEALITDLAGISALRVISRTSAMQYKHARKALPIIADELGVDAIIEGSVQRHGNRIRITVQLLDARHERHLWAANYDHDFRDVLLLQSEVARAVTEQIKVKLTAAEQSRSARGHSVDPEAFEAYLKGKYYAHKFTQESLHKAIDYFQRAIEKNRDYAPAYAALADCYVEAVVIDNSRPREAFALAQPLIMKALEIDSMVPEAHLEMAMLAWRFHWDWKMAANEFQRALELNPGFAGARQRYGWYLFARGQYDESVVQLTRALKDDPLSLWIHSNVGFALYYARRYDAALEHLTETLETDGNFLPALVALGWVHEQKGMFSEAISTFKKAISISSGLPIHVACLAHTYALAGETVEAQRLLDALAAESRRKYVPEYWVATAFAALGDTEQAFHWLERAYEAHDSWMVYLNVDPRLDALHSDARFGSLLRRIGLQP